MVLWVQSKSGFSGRGWGQQLFSFRVRRFSEWPGPLHWIAFPVEIIEGVPSIKIWEPQFFMWGGLVSFIFQGKSPHMKNFWGGILTGEFSGYFFVFRCFSRSWNILKTINRCWTTEWVPVWHFGVCDFLRLFPWAVSSLQSLQVNCDVWRVFAKLLCNINHRQAFWPLISIFASHLDGRTHSLHHSKRKFTCNSAKPILANGAMRVATRP